MNRRWRREILNVVCHFHSAFGWIYTSHLTHSLSPALPRHCVWMIRKTERNSSKWESYAVDLWRNYNISIRRAVCLLCVRSIPIPLLPDDTFFSSSLFLNLCSTCGIEFHDADAPIWLSFRVALIIHNMAFHSFQWRGESELSLERNVILCSFVSLRWMIQTSVCTV